MKNLITKITENYQPLVEMLYDDFSKKLSKDEFQKYITRYFHLFPPKCYLFFLDEENIGCAILNENVFDYLMISYIYIKKEHRKNGYASYFLKKIIEDENKNYTLWCEEQNIEFYKKFNFYDSKFKKQDLTMVHLMFLDKKDKKEINYELIPVI